MGLGSWPILYSNFKVCNAVCLKEMVATGSSFSTISADT